MLIIKDIYDREYKPTEHLCDSQVYVTPNLYFILHKHNLINNFILEYDKLYNNYELQSLGFDVNSIKNGFDFYEQYKKVIVFDNRTINSYCDYNPCTLSSFKYQYYIFKPDRRRDILYPISTKIGMLMLDENIVNDSMMLRMRNIMKVDNILNIDIDILNFTAEDNWRWTFRNGFSGQQISKLTSYTYHIEKNIEPIISHMQ